MYPTAEAIRWSLPRKILFRFLFIYFLLQLWPLGWLDSLPGVSYLTRYYGQLMDWAVQKSNAYWFHVRKVLVPLNGSGDTSYGWAQLYLFLYLSALGCIVWSMVDRKRPAYERLNYWLCVCTRYYIALISFTYGFDKVFLQQMGFPSQSQLATPLGDFLPMRFSWLFIGYSGPYQFFSGLMEVVAGLLLLFRRTATLGLFVATGVFMNVMMLNLCYDIPVKIFSMHMVFYCLFLLANEYRRISSFLLNRPAPAGRLYVFPYRQKGLRIGRVVLKLAFVVLLVGLPFCNYVSAYNEKPAVKKLPIRDGFYAVVAYTLKSDSGIVQQPDSLRWRDVIFEKGSRRGSIQTTDTLFRQRYRRGYFTYSVDSATQTLFFTPWGNDTTAFLRLRFQLPDTSRILLWGKLRNDSLYVELKRTPRHFQLAEKQFHWLTEYNR